MQTVKRTEGLAAGCCKGGAIVADANAERNAQNPLEGSIEGGEL